ncbi:DUF983 domain-containing protein [Flavobacteriales bacterium]|nr:DUF983 domain-containing protein [Flavobacteriales bacterium]
MLKKTRLYSILNFKCPRCHKGEFLESRNVYNLKQAGNLREKCDRCNLKYSREPGFYFGAMFVSYALGVALFVAIWVATAVLYPAYSSELLLGIIIGAIIILGPYMYALSKIIWANLFFHYEVTELKKNK